MGWIGDSMGWKSKSMGCFGRTAAWTHKNLAKRRTKVGVRFNGLPYSAHAAGDVCRKAAADVLTAGCGEKNAARGFLIPAVSATLRPKTDTDEAFLSSALLTGAAPLPAGATDGHVCFGTPRPEAAGRALLQGKRRQGATGKSIFFVILHPKPPSTTKKTC